MNTYDHIIASAYYVFEEQLNPKIITAFLLRSSYNGNTFERDELRLKVLKDIIILVDGKYKLNEGYTISDLNNCINFDMVTFFQNLKKARENYYSGLEDKQKRLNYKRGI